MFKTETIIAFYSCSFFFFFLRISISILVLFFFSFYSAEDDAQMPSDHPANLILMAFASFWGENDAFPHRSSDRFCICQDTFLLKKQPTNVAQIILVILFTLSLFDVLLVLFCFCGFFCRETFAATPPGSLTGRYTHAVLAEKFDKWLSSSRWGRYPSADQVFIKNCVRFSFHWRVFLNF